MGNQRILASEAVLKQYGAILSGKTVLITGVSADSIAGELAVQIAAYSPARLIISARNNANMVAVAEKIRSKGSHTAVQFLEMDLANLSNIRSAVQSLESLETIDHLICVAGVMCPPYERTVDGLETQFGVNYVANFELVRLLLDKVRAAAPQSSIIIASSAAMRVGKIDFDDIGFSGGEKYDLVAAYAQSNVARIMFAKSLALKLADSGIRVFSVDPGAVTTGLQRHFTAEFIKMVTEIRNSGTMTDLDGREWPIAPRTSKSEGAANFITAMIDPTISSFNGAFLSNNAVADEELHSLVTNSNDWEKLWKLTEKLIGNELRCK